MGIKVNLADGFFDCNACESSLCDQQMALWRVFRACGASWKQLCTSTQEDNYNASNYVLCDPALVPSVSGCKLHQVYILEK